MGIKVGWEGVGEMKGGQISTTLGSGMSVDNIPDGQPKWTLQTWAVFKRKALWSSVWECSIDENVL